MKYLYSIKGCSHCSRNSKCKSKNSEKTLLKKVKTFEDMGGIWESFCKRFER